MAQRRTTAEEFGSDEDESKRSSFADQMGFVEDDTTEPVPDTVDSDKLAAARRGEISATQVSSHADENDVIQPPGYVETVSRAFPGTTIVEETETETL